MYIVILILLLISITLILFSSFLKEESRVKKIKRNHEFCILIPARYESKVIENLLISIKKQSYKINMKNVYVIVESNKDETVNICKKYDCTVFIRKELKKQRKGYALDECEKDILKNKKHYDAYFIFDADNVLDKDFIKNMAKSYDLGYDLVSGYRNTKNGNDSVVAASSSLTFSLVNELFNESKCNKNKNITFSGTGFFISGYIIEKLEGYPFNTLTEDYEISMYATINNLTTYYNKDACFYDEQPIRFKDTINQRTRWIKGYFSVRKLYTKKLIKSYFKDKCNRKSKLSEIIGVLPFAIIILACLLFLINLAVTKTSIIYYIIFLTIIYLALQLVTMIILFKEEKKLALNNLMKVKVIFYNPIFLCSFLICGLKALFTKDVKWSKVEHGIDNKEK